MLFNFLSPPKVGGEYRGGFIALIWNKASLSSNKTAIKQNIAAIASTICTLLSTLPTSPRLPPSEGGGVNSMLFNFLSPPKVGGEYRGGFLALIFRSGIRSSEIKYY